MHFVCSILPVCHGSMDIQFREKKDKKDVHV